MTCQTMDATLKEGQLQVSPELLHVERTALLTVFGVQNPQKNPKTNSKNAQAGNALLAFPRVSKPEGMTLQDRMEEGRR